MKINLKLLFVLILSVFSLACNKDDERIMILSIAAYKVEYRYPMGGHTMGYYATDSDNNKFAIDYISGFDNKYEEGYEYFIKVRQVENGKNQKPKEDVFGHSYYLLKMISKTKVEQ